MKIRIDQIQSSLQKEAPYFREEEARMRVDSYLEKNPPRKASVLICLLNEEIQGQKITSLLFTVRSSQLPHHAGQISFPGGGKHRNETFSECALRETHEEVGIPQNEIEIIGELPPYPSFASRYLITPVIGILNHVDRKENLRLNQREVDYSFWTPIQDLTSPTTFQTSLKSYEGINYDAHQFNWGEFRIWGITAHITANFLERLGILSF